VEYGVGASAVWRTRGTTAESAAEISSQEIIAAQAPEFVQSALFDAALQRLKTIVEAE